jgi:hypothetical protein
LANERVDLDFKAVEPGVHAAFQIAHPRLAAAYPGVEACKPGIKACKSRINTVEACIQRIVLDGVCQDSH